MHVLLVRIISESINRMRAYRVDTTNSAPDRAMVISPSYWSCKFNISRYFETDFSGAMLRNNKVSIYVSPGRFSVSLMIILVDGDWLAINARRGSGPFAAGIQTGTYTNDKYLVLPGSTKRHHSAAWKSRLSGTFFVPLDRTGRGTQYLQRRLQRRCS
jgi:hypothetical protein